MIKYLLRKLFDLVVVGGVSLHRAASKESANHTVVLTVKFSSSPFNVLENKGGIPSRSQDI